jgi:hypothetical protein
VDNEWSYRWLEFEDIKGEKESKKVAAQDQTQSKTSLKIKFLRKKLTVNAGCVNNMKKLLPVLPQDNSFWQIMST